MKSKLTCPPTRFIRSIDCTVGTHTGCQLSSFNYGQLFVCACDCHRTKHVQLALWEVNHGPVVPESLGSTGAVG